MRSPCFISSASLQLWPPKWLWPPLAFARLRAKVRGFLLPLRGYEQREQRGQKLHATLASQWPALVSFSFLKKKQAKAARLPLASQWPALVSFSFLKKKQAKAARLELPTARSRGEQRSRAFTNRKVII
jgi:hypothetical protein